VEFLGSLCEAVLVDNQLLIAIKSSMNKEADSDFGLVLSLDFRYNEATVRGCANLTRRPKTPKRERMHWNTSQGSLLAPCQAPVCLNQTME
jgi:hypothetical protein